MKIYLAGGMTVMNVKGRERELSNKFDRWNRIFSFFYYNTIIASDIINITKETKKNYQKSLE